MAGDPYPKPPPRPPKPPRRLPPMSKKRQRERTDRERVVLETNMRFGGQCQAKALVPEVDCWGPLDTHEIEARGTHPGSHLNDAVTTLVCRVHHDWIDAHPRRAEELGLRRRAIT